MNDQLEKILNTFVERESLQEFMENLTIFYEDFRSKFNERTENLPGRLIIFLFLLTSTLSFIIYEHQRFIRISRAIIQRLVPFLRNQFSRIKQISRKKSKSSIFNFLFNKKSPFYEKFFSEIHRRLNENLLKGQVNKKNKSFAFFS